MGVGREGGRGGRVSGFRTIAAIAASASLIAAAAPAVLAQDATPPNVAPLTTPTSAAAPAPSAEFTVGAPHLQTVAQGLGVIDGPMVWRVREVGITDAAQQEAGPTSFALQRTGASILRNDLTTRRMRLEPGEAAFLTGGDPFTRVAVGKDPSIAWVIELLPQAAASTPGAGTTLLTSDPIPDYPLGTIDLELSRGVLLPGEVSELPQHTGMALVMIASGRVQVSAVGEPPTPVGAGNGLLAPGALTLRNGDTQPASFVVATLGEPVEGAEGASSGAPVEAAPVATTAAQPAATAAPGQPAAPTAPAGQSAMPTQPPLMQTPVPVATLPPVAPPPVPVEPTAVPAMPTAAPPTDANPTEGDTDGDGLSDVDEAAYGSDPLNKDYDADGLLDGEEVYVYGTDPLNNDSDGDGLLDGEEVNSLGTSPASFDSDGDGLGDADEVYTYSTSPSSYDTDGDGISDGEEVNVYGTNPLDPASGP